jgi:hypothetical protein
LRANTRQHKNKKSMSSEDAEGEGGRPTLGFTITEALAAEEIVKKSFFQGEVLPAAEEILSALQRWLRSGCTPVMVSQDVPSTWSQREPFWSLSGKCSLFNITLDGRNRRCQEVSRYLRDDISKYGWTCFIETIGAVVTVRCSLC